MKWFTLADSTSRYDVDRELLREAARKLCISTILLQHIFLEPAEAMLATRTGEAAPFIQSLAECDRAVANAFSQVQNMES
jgi:hypothetical protein